MTLNLTKEQMRLVHQAVESLKRDLQKEVQQVEKPTIRGSIEESIFQLELLETWFDRQKEMDRF